jgi:hypothetical protein
MERHTAKVEEWLAHLAEPPGTLDPATSRSLDQPDPANRNSQVDMPEAARPETPAPEAREEAGNAPEPKKCTPRKAGLVQLGERLGFGRDEQYRLLKHCLTKDPDKVCSYKSAADFFAALNLSPCWQRWHQAALDAVAGVTEPELGAKINGWQGSWRKEGGPPAEKWALDESDKEGLPSHALKPCSWATDLAETVRNPQSATEAAGLTVRPAVLHPQGARTGDIRLVAQAAARLGPRRLRHQAGRLARVRLQRKLGDRPGLHRVHHRSCF